MERDLGAVEDLDEVGCADALVAVLAEQRRAAARRLALVAHWADLHHPDRELPADAVPARTRRQRHREDAGGDGTPEVSRWAIDELGCLLGISTITAHLLLRDVLNLRHRHPMLWAAVQVGQVEDWVARKVAQAAHTADLSLAQCHHLDAATTAAVTSLPAGRALRVVQARVIAADPAGHEHRRQVALRQRYVTTKPAETDGLRMVIARTTTADAVRLDAMLDHLADLLPTPEDEPATRAERRAVALGILANPAQACVLLAHTQPQDPEEAEPSTAQQAATLGAAIAQHGPGALDRLRPRTVLYLHLAPDSPVARGETHGPLTLPELTDWLPTEHLTLTPVLDLHAQPGTDAYETPTRLAEALAVAHAYEVFPYGTLASRHADKDHTVAYRPGGPPGQTRLENLGPLSRRHHQLKTDNRFTLHQPLPGHYYWRTPTGHWYEVTAHGTRHHGRTEPPLLTATRPTHTRAELHYADHLRVTLAA